MRRLILRTHRSEAAGSQAGPAGPIGVCPVSSVQRGWARGQGQVCAPGHQETFANQLGTALVLTSRRLFTRERLGRAVSEVG